MHNLYQESQKGIKNNNFEALPEAHATSSGLKAVTTILASEGIEECRKSLGGHGYLLNSGLGELFTGYVSNNTLEGENFVIIQQLSRYLIKTFKGAQSGQAAVGNAQYLNSVAKHQFLTVTVATPADLLNPANQLAAYANRAGFLIAQVSKRVDELTKQGQPFATAFQAVQWLSTRASRAHCMFAILTSFVKAVGKAPAELAGPLKDVCDLFALYHLEKDLGDFLEAGQFSSAQTAWIHEQTEAALRRVRPNAVALVDAFNHSDRDLNSVLGKYDGNVYEALFNATKLEPLNKQDVVECYQDVIRPIITKDFKPASKL